MSPSRVLLLTPPFTQINTPYPATCYLKGYLNTLGISSHQADLSLEVFLKLFSKDGLRQVFDEIEALDLELSESAFRIFAIKEEYLNTIDFIVQFLQNSKSTFAHRIVAKDFLPRGKRFADLELVEHAFGDLSLIDRAKYLSTLFLEDIGDFVKETVDPHFGFSRYAERLATALSQFSVMSSALSLPDYVTSRILKETLTGLLEEHQPTLVVITVPFPGNLFSALKCGQFIKKAFPGIKIALGGGYPNTELRSLQDETIFEFVDYITLDDGEAPLKILIEYLEGKCKRDALKRTFLFENGVVQYCNGGQEKDIPQREVGTPDYAELKLDKYLSVLEVANPMHRLWSDGRWNKLTMAHGCYWGKCTFCDVTLDYIARYEPISASILCDRIETLITQTGDHGFHFVDEAAPPALMRELALEIIRRRLIITWWANIRFEKAFTADLCRLLSASGCVAISGGLEVASDRLLALIKKGVTVEQVTNVAYGFTQAGIMVHAYLMYGFPTETDQETIDSQEVVRQLFKNKVIQSGFWHQFSMTAHSPIGVNPQAFSVNRVGPVFAGFAENDLEHEDPLGADHQKYSGGLSTSLFNYMNGLGLESPLDDWFEFSVPETGVAKDLIEKIIDRKVNTFKIPSHAKVLWIGGTPVSAEEVDGDLMLLEFSDRQGDWSIAVAMEIGAWFLDLFAELSIDAEQSLSYSEFQQSFEHSVGTELSGHMNSDFFPWLCSRGLIFV